MREINFPPYGQVARVYHESMEPNALAPVAWEPHLPLSEREKHFFIWRESVLSEINRVLWPQWNPATRNWSAMDARPTALTNVDFDVFETINAQQLLETGPDSLGAAASIPTHLHYFQDEDTGKTGERYFFYDTTLPPKQLNTFTSDARKVLKHVGGSVSVQFKQRLQRPRAYQVASLLGRTHRFELAVTSMTPSMSSGHCFDGCLIGAGIYEQWLDGGFQPTAIQKGSLAQFAVDMGDRRVYAGVHYPSDNLSSWIIMLSLSNKVFRRPETHGFISDAIMKHSEVWKFIKDAHDKAYEDALNLIERLAG